MPAEANFTQNNPASMVDSFKPNPAQQQLTPRLTPFAQLKPPFFFARGKAHRRSNVLFLPKQYNTADSSQYQFGSQRGKVPHLPLLLPLVLRQELHLQVPHPLPHLLPQQGLLPRPGAHLLHLRDLRQQAAAAPTSTRATAPRTSSSTTSTGATAPRTSSSPTPSAIVPRAPDEPQPRQEPQCLDGGLLRP